MNSGLKPVRISFYGRRIVYICPRCGKPITFKKLYQGKSLCMKCGQRLDWSPVEKLQTETIIAENATDAAIIAERYYTACGMNEKDWFDLNEFRKSLVERDPYKPPHRTELYLFFKDPKEYGRYKRLCGGKR